MKLGDIKIEALKLMFVDFVTDYAAEDITSLSTDESCRDYLANMPGAINRCFADLERRGVIPAKSVELGELGRARKYGNVRYKLKDIIPDFGRIERVSRESEDGEYCAACSYRLEGGVLVLRAPDIRTYTEDGVEKYEERETYTLIYRPTLDRISRSTSDEVEIDLPDSIANLIPYYVKGDVYRMDEPDEAGEARNWYEAAINELLYEAESSQECVETVFDMGDDW